MSAQGKTLAPIIELVLYRKLPKETTLVTVGFISNPFLVRYFRDLLAATGFDATFFFFFGGGGGGGVVTFGWSLLS